MQISLREVGKELVIQRKPKSYPGEDPAGRGGGGGVGVLPSRLISNGDVLCCWVGLHFHCWIALIID